MQEQRDRKLEADALRYRYLASIVEGNLNCGDLLVVAAGGTTTARRLRRIRLVDLMEASTGLPRHQARKLVRKVTDLSGIVPQKLPRHPTVGWLLDGRTCTRRLAAWADVVDSEGTFLDFFPFGEAI